MKKIILAPIIGLCMLFGAVFAQAQDVRFGDVPDTLVVKPVAAYSIGDFGNDWRAGLGFPFLSIKNGRSEDFPTIATIDVWALSDAKDFKRTFLGGGLDLPLFNTKHMRLGLVGGWSADFADLENIKDGRWGIGASLTIRF